MAVCYDLTLDIDVLMRGSGIGNPEYHSSCLQLMKEMDSKEKFLVALDSKGKIAHQYGKILRQGTYGHSWLIHMAAKNKTKIILWRSLDKGTQVKLREAHFDSSVGEDYKYVVTAAGSDCKLLVSHDSDYTKKVRTILRKGLKVRVKAARDCCAL